MAAPRLLEVVALLEELPAHRLLRGQVGTIVEVLDADAFEVEFSDNSGRTVASVPLRSSQFLILHPEVAAAD